MTASHQLTFFFRPQEVLCCQSSLPLPSPAQESPQLGSIAAVQDIFENSSTVQTKFDCLAFFKTDLSNYNVILTLAFKLSFCFVACLGVILIAECTILSLYVNKISRL